MDNKEMLYEISLKYNTLKMYDNTIEQMKKNGSDKYLESIENERDAVQKELEELLNPNTQPVNEEGYRTNPKVERENEFIKALHEPKFEDEYEFEGEWEEDEDWDNEESQEEEDKPRLADVQDKISNSTWISQSNFIFRFPKDEINIDEWRVSSFSYSLNQVYQNMTCSCDGFDDEDEPKKKIKHSGNLFIAVNDFSEKINDYQYNILSQIVLSLYENPILEKNINVDVIDNNGNLLYTLVFVKCRFTGTNGITDSFDYESSALNRIQLTFFFKDVIVLAPNEDLG